MEYDIGVCSKAEYAHLKAKHISLGLKHDKLDQEFNHYKHKYKVQAGLVEEMISKNKELDELTKEQDDLKKRIEELEADARPAEEETEEGNNFLTQAQLIAKIRELEQDCMVSLGVGFSTTIKQIKVVNPQVELVTKGINPYYKVVAGEIIILEGVEDEEEEVEDS